MAAHNRLSLINDNLLLWRFTAQAFAAFYKVYNLTYLYKAQIQSLYYQFHGIAVSIKSVFKNDRGEYQIADYRPEYDNSFREQLLTKVDLYRGKYNDIGRKHTALSRNWFGKAKKPRLDSFGNTIRNFFRKKDAKADDALWAVFGDWEKKVCINGYATGFLACNERATNDYKDRSVLHKRRVQWASKTFHISSAEYKEAACLWQTSKRYSRWVQCGYSDN